MMVKLNGHIFCLMMMNFQKNIIIFGTKSVIVLEKNLSVNPFTIKIFKTKIQPCIDESTEFHDKEMPNIGSNYSHLPLIFS